MAQTVAESDSTIIIRQPFVKQMVKPTLFVAAGTSVAFLLDKPAQSVMLRSQSAFGDDFTRISNYLGDKKIMVPALAATLGSSYLLNDSRLKRTSWDAVKSLVVASIVAEAFKTSAGRARPFMNEGPHSFHPFNGADYYKSLPSGHATVAFAIFTPYAETYSRWLYLVPASVAYSRMYKNKHWFSDVVVGGGLGFLSGYFFSHHPRKKIVLIPGGVTVYF
jgi:membrane-associated phospholipid phosphatase